MYWIQLGVAYMTSTFKGVCVCVCVCVCGCVCGWVGGERGCIGRPIFIFLLKKIGFAPWPDIMLSQLLTRYLLVASCVRQWSHALMIPLHCLWEQCRTIERVVSLNVTWLGFAFVLISFVNMHGAVVVR